MIHQPTLPSPLHRLEQLSTAWGVDLWAKRDDLIPQYMGGNKVRKNFGILQRKISASDVPDVLITNGGAESNHARVVALMGAQLGCEVHLVLHGKKPSANNTSGNSFFYRCAGATTHYVDSHDIGATIDAVSSKVRKKNLTTLIIPGGGHSIDGVHEYAKALDELPFEPDYIVHASGTGGTQAGLLKGVANRGWRTKIIGISVAREAERGADEIAKLLPVNFPREKIIFHDEYRFGGYEKISEKLIIFLKNVVKDEGMPLDFTYTGKAIFGLHDLLATGKIKPKSKIVFWHTGGLLNLTSLEQKVKNGY